MTRHVHPPSHHDEHSRAYPCWCVDAAGFTSRLLLAIHSSIIRCMINWSGLLESLLLYIGIVAWLQEKKMRWNQPSRSTYHDTTGEFPLKHTQKFIGQLYVLSGPDRAPPSRRTLLFPTAKQKERLRGLNSLMHGFIVASTSAGCDAGEDRRGRLLSKLLIGNHVDWYVRENYE